MGLSHRESQQLVAVFAEFPCSTEPSQKGIPIMAGLCDRIAPERPLVFPSKLQKVIDVDP